MDLGFNLAQSNRDLKDLTSRQIFGDTSGLLCKNDLIPCHMWTAPYLYDAYFWYFHIGWKTLIRIIMRMNCLQFYRGPIVILLVSGSVGGDNINKRHFLHNYIQEFIQQVFFQLCPGWMTTLMNHSWPYQMKSFRFQDSDWRESWICSPCVISGDLRKESLRNCTLARSLARCLARSLARSLLISN